MSHPIDPELSEVLKRFQELEDSFTGKDKDRVAGAIWHLMNWMNWNRRPYQCDMCDREEAQD